MSAAPPPLPDCKVKRNYACVECDFFTQNPRVHLYHLRDAHADRDGSPPSRRRRRLRIHECASCLYASRHLQKLLRHRKMVHGEDEAESPASAQPAAAVFKCSVCDYSSRGQSQLTRHEREEHIKTRFFRCSKCTYVTHIKARYTKHVKYHSMPMIKCDMCDFRTPYKWNLDRHCKNHNGHGAFRCSACNFTADIKQSLTVHEMNHHVPPVGQAAGLGVGRRRNKVGASDATAAEEEEAAGGGRRGQVAVSEPEPEPPATLDEAKKPKKAKPFQHDFIDPDDIVSHANGKVYLKNKCKLCNFKTAWDSEMAKHQQKVHHHHHHVTTKKPPRPIPNLIPIPSQAKQRHHAFPVLKAAEIPQPSEPEISQKVMNDICAKSSNSVLKDFASLFGSEDVFDSALKVPDLIPATMYNNPKTKLTEVVFKQKNASFFDNLREKLELGTNLTCNLCGHESKCLTEQAKHQKSCGKEASKAPNVIPMHNTSSTRCQACRQRCKSSTDLYNHLRSCPEALRARSLAAPKDDAAADSESENELKIDLEEESAAETKPHPMENKVFVWNDILVPMDIEVDDSNYEYTEDRVDDNVSLDLSVRTQSPLDSEGSYPGPALRSPLPPAAAAAADKVPTHGNDISVAQHKRVFKCPHCTFWASTASRFHVHIVGHLNKKPFECSLCSYRSNWRWDITKHIKLKSVRDAAHEAAKVLMTDETGRRNYTKYNKYLTEIPVSSQQSMDTSGGCGTRPKHHDRSAAAATPSTSKGEPPKLNRIAAAAGGGAEGSQPSKAADKGLLAEAADRKRSNGDGKRTLFKCKKCNFKDASRDVLLQHVKGHYQQQPAQQHQQQQQPISSLASEGGASTSGGGGAQDLRLRGTMSPDRDEASVNNKPGGGCTATAPFRCGHCNQVSNWKHVIQRHCRLKHSGDIRVVSTKNGHEKVEVEEITDEPDHLDVTQEGTFKCNFYPFSNDDKKFRCATCPYVTNSKSQYSYHKQFHKPRGGQYTCEYCSYNVSKRHLLHQHLKVHGVNVASHKQNGDGVEIADEIEVVQVGIDFQGFVDIPLVWVSKNGKFSKMFKCRYCPHVNLRKVNIQEHEKMHSVREKNHNSARLNDTEHRCGECNYVCNNAGVLSSHSKVHQGMYGLVHRLVDPTKTDEEQIKELSPNSPAEPEAMEIEEIDSSSGSGSLLYFCKECPARFLKENEFGIHKRFHGLRLFYRCDHCTYTSREKPHVSAHAKVHTGEYQDRTRVLQSMYLTSTNYPRPETRASEAADGETVWAVRKEMSTLCSILSKPAKSAVPLSGTDLFLQKSEAEAELINEKPVPDELTRGNPDFVYQPYLKNGRLKEKRYKCHLCPTAFEKREQYRVHLGLHGSEQRYRCDRCDYSVKYYANFVQHLKKHKMDAEARAGGPEEGGERRFRCADCPFAGSGRAALDEHRKRHAVRSAHACEHCDYSVAEPRFLAEHTKVHFVPNRVNRVEGFMVCDGLRLTSEGGVVEEDDERLVFEERGSDLFLPSLGAERFNNNEGEKQFVNVQTGEIVGEFSDMRLPGIKEERETEVN